jgi:hypothetical protein
MHQDERRVLKRFPIKGGKVTYSLAEGPESTVDLIDLSKNSARFQMTEKLANGDLVNLEITIPPNKPIKLNGRVVWISMAREAHPAYAAVQFIPYSTEEFRTTPAFKQLDVILRKLE